MLDELKKAVAAGAYDRAGVLAKTVVPELEAKIVELEAKVASLEEAAKKAAEEKKDEQAEVSSLDRLKKLTGKGVSEKKDQPFAYRAAMPGKRPKKGK